MSLPSFKLSRSSGSVGIPLDDGILQRDESRDALVPVIDVGLDTEVLTKRRSMSLVLVAWIDGREVVMDPPVFISSASSKRHSTEQNFGDIHDEVSGQS